ncbi:hypothetical protein COW81_00800 [Candidatus Campbellbacteria bacterium CG22_combo_CG10-13_8_21_14_all_36_13]|uniref:Uncharacterized protein n=1 Tax=Candidatus Campbellbacteria bacterium CG22_combo_CG10-13_8_21_14_all_36_13 TaxID=1974529 RepID=A0A2H0DYT9_9BACT|nr:MAG: hypothetical protein COW81_00800 [Candidatus Campbellbacteria bacterium CG22_combo_CG10-13_8_21_14_all_36_13]
MALDLEKIKEELEQDLARLEKELATVGHKNPDNPNDWEPQPEYNDPTPLPDRNDAADAIIDFEENTALLKDLEIQFNNVKRALKKIEDGTYGIDEVDGEPIPEERLLANHSARTKVENSDAVENNN